MSVDPTKHSETKINFMDQTRIITLAVVFPHAHLQIISNLPIQFQQYHYLLLEGYKERQTD